MKTCKGRQDIHKKKTKKQRPWYHLEIQNVKTRIKTYEAP